MFSSVSRKEMPKFVYVLQCTDGKYYVGQTDNIIRRFEEHKTGRGASWTKLYPALAILKLMESTGNDFIELSLTLETMNVYGVSNVRGGPFAHIELSTTDLKSIFNILRQNAWPLKWMMKECDKPLLPASPADTDEDDSTAPEKRRRVETPRHGMAWLKEEDDQLTDELSKKVTLQECADTHQRSLDSILARRLVLIKKFITANSTMDLRLVGEKFNVTPSMLTTLSV